MIFVNYITFSEESVRGIMDTPHSFENIHIHIFNVLKPLIVKIKRLIKISVWIPIFLILNSCVIYQSSPFNYEGTIFLDYQPSAKWDYTSHDNAAKFLKEVPKKSISPYTPHHK